MMRDLNARALWAGDFRHFGKSVNSRDSQIAMPEIRESRFDAIEPPGSRRVDFRAENSRFLRFGGSWKRFLNKSIRLTPLSVTKHSKIGGNRPGARVTAIGPQNCAILGPKTTKMPGPEAPKFENFENQNSATIRCAMTRGIHLYTF